MGVGKTAAGKYIADHTPGTAFIDGDWCLDIHPFVLHKAGIMVRNYLSSASLQFARILSSILSNNRISSLVKPL